MDNTLSQPMSILKVFKTIILFWLKSLRHVPWLSILFAFTTYAAIHCDEIAVTLQNSILPEIVKTDSAMHLYVLFWSLASLLIFVILLEDLKERLNNKSPSFSDSLDQGLSYFFPMLFLIILVSIFMGIPSAVFLLIAHFVGDQFNTGVFIALGICLFVLEIYFLPSYALITTEDNPSRSLSIIKQSIQLVKGRWWHTAIVYLLTMSAITAIYYLSILILPNILGELLACALTISLALSLVLIQQQYLVSYQKQKQAF